MGVGMKKKVHAQGTTQDREVTLPTQSWHPAPHHAQGAIQLSLARPFPPAHQLPLWYPNERDRCSISNNRQHCPPHTCTNLHIKALGATHTMMHTPFYLVST